MYEVNLSSKAKRRIEAAIANPEQPAGTRKEVSCDTSTEGGERSEDGGAGSADNSVADAFRYASLYSRSNGAECVHVYASQRSIRPDSDINHARLMAKIHEV
jgi:hypothetical protein